MANNATQQFDYLREMIGTPLGGSVTAEKRNIPLTEEMTAGLKPKVQFGEDIYWGKPTEEARMATLPETIGGQYITDPSQTGTMFKFERSVPERLKRYALQGLPSFAFDVDHIIPLSLGGTNETSNLQVLNYKEHDKKTKVGAVVNELYFGKKLSLAEARNKAINFQGMNVEDVTLDENGRMPINLAQQIYNSWGEAPKVGVKEWLKEIPKTPGMLLGKAGAKVGEVMPETPLGEFGKGFAEEMTLGWMDVPTEQYATEKQQLTADIARGVGKFTGFLVSFGMMYKWAGLAAKAALGTKAIKGTSFAKWVAQASAPITSKQAVFKAGSIVFPRNVALKALQNAGAFTLHGQLSRQQEKGFDERVKRFFSDAAFGSVLAIPGQTMKGYAGLSAAVYTLSALEGATPAEALMNTAIVAGLHGIGGIHNKFVQGNRMDILATSAATKVLKKWGIEPKKYYGSDARVQSLITKERNTAVNKILRETDSFEEARLEISKLMIAQRQLYKGGLSREAKLFEDVTDIRSMTQRTLNLNSAAMEDIPAEARILNNVMLRPFYERQAPSKAEKVSKVVFPTDPAGVQTVGTSLEHAPMTSRDIRALQELGLKNGDRVIVYKAQDPKTIEFIKQKNERLPIAERDANPENILNTVIIRDGKIYRFGNIPSEKKIGTRYDPATGDAIVTVGGESPYSLNSKALTAKKPQMDPTTMNKNSISQAMTDNKWNYVIGEIWGVPRGTGVGVASGEPWGRVRFTPQTIEESVRYNEAIDVLRARESGESISRVRQAIGEITARQKPVQEATAADAITKMVPTVEADSLFLTVKGFENQLAREGGSARFYEQNIKGLTNRTMTSAEKQAIETRIKDNDITVGDYIQWISREKANNTLNRQGSAMFEYLLGPSGSYPQLSQVNKSIINSFKLRPSAKVVAKMPKKVTGEIQQKLPLKAIEAPEKKKVEIAEIIQKVSKEVKKVEEKKKTEVVKKIEIPVKKEVEAVKKKPSDFKALTTELKITPKVKMAEKTAKEYETVGKDALDNVDVGTQARGSLSIADYGAKLKSSIETLRPPVSKKAPAAVRLNDAELAKIRDAIKPTLYQHAINLLRVNFEPKSQASFTGKTVADIEKQYLKALGLTKEREIKPEIKKITAEERQKGWGEKEKMDKLILELLGKKEADIHIPKTKQIKDVQTLLEKNIKKFKDKDNYAEGFNTVLHQGLEKMFGKNYASGKKSWALNSLFSLNTTKGRRLWDRMGLKLTPKGGTEAQPKDVSKLEYEMIVEKGKPYTEWTQKERDIVYGKRKKEAVKETEKREAERKEKLTGLAKEAKEIGFSIGERKVSEFVTDLSGYDLIAKMRLAGETGKKMNAKAGATDAKSLLSELQKTFNSYAQPGKKVFVKFEELQTLVDKFKIKKD